MAITAIVATVASAGASIYGANKQAAAMRTASMQQQEQAAADQKEQSAQAERDRLQAAKIAAEQKQFEDARAAAASQQATDVAMGAQNSKTSGLTPTVQLAAEGDGLAGATKTRQRRAQFRPEYTSGVTI